SSSSLIMRLSNRELRRLTCVHSVRAFLPQRSVAASCWFDPILAGMALSAALIAPAAATPPPAPATGRHKACADKYSEHLLQRISLYCDDAIEPQIQDDVRGRRQNETPADRHRQPGRGHLEAVERRLLHRLERWQGRLLHGGCRWRQQMVGAQELDHY